MTCDIFNLGNLKNVKKKDEGASMRFMKQQHKLSFQRVYDLVDGKILHSFMNRNNFLIEGGFASVVRFNGSNKTVILLTEKAMKSGVHRVICRGIVHSKISVGLIRKSITDGRQSITKARKDMHLLATRLCVQAIIGLEYDADRGTLIAYSLGATHRRIRKTHDQKQRLLRNLLCHRRGFAFSIFEEFPSQY